MNKFLLLVTVVLSLIIAPSIILAECPNQQKKSADCWQNDSLRSSRLASIQLVP